MIKEETWSISVQRARSFFREQEGVEEENINTFLFRSCRITLTELKPKGMGVWAAKRIRVRMEGDDAENVNYAKELITETKAAYPHLLLNESLYMSFMGAVSAVPTTFFVRQDGSLIGYLTGAQSKENWKALIDRLLAEEQ